MELVPSLKRQNKLCTNRRWTQKCVNKVWYAQYVLSILNWFMGKNEVQRCYGYVLIVPTMQCCFSVDLYVVYFRQFVCGRYTFYLYHTLLIPVLWNKFFTTIERKRMQKQYTIYYSLFVPWQCHLHVLVTWLPLPVLNNRRQAL